MWCWLWVFPGNENVIAGDLRMANWSAGSNKGKGIYVNDMLADSQTIRLLLKSQQFVIYTRKSNGFPLKRNIFTFLYQYSFQHMKLACKIFSGKSYGFPLKKYMINFVFTGKSYGFPLTKYMVNFVLNTYLQFCNRKLVSIYEPSWVSALQTKRGLFGQEECLVIIHMSTKTFNMWLNKRAFGQDG